MKRLILTLILCLLFIPSFAAPRASSKVEPKWMKVLPKASNPSFTYQIATSAAATSSAAVDGAIEKVFISEGMQHGVLVSHDRVSNRNSEQQYVDGKFSEKIDINTQTTVNARSQERMIYVMDIDSYWEVGSDGRYNATVLVAKSNGSMRPYFDQVEATDMYGAHGLWRSMIIPGWGQFYKGSNLKGGLMLSGVAVAAVGAVFTDTMAGDYYSKMALTYDVSAMRTYKTKGDQFASARNVCIGVAGALYLYNIIDAVAAPGARRIKVKSSGLTNFGYIDYSFAPTVTTDGAVGFGANMRF